MKILTIYIFLNSASPRLRVNQSFSISASLRETTPEINA